MYTCEKSSSPHELFHLEIFNFSHLKFVMCKCYLQKVVLKSQEVLFSFYRIPIMNGPSYTTFETSIHIQYTLNITYYTLKKNTLKHRQIILIPLVYNISKCIM